MSEFNAGRQGPWPSEGRARAEHDHEQDLLEEAQHVREVREAEGRGPRRWWWPFGRRRAREEGRIGEAPRG